MAVELSRWYDEVATQASGASIKGIELALKSTVAEFMRESAAFAMELPGLTLRANKSTYYIPRPDDGPIIHVYAMLYQNRPLRAVSARAWAELSPPEPSEAPTRFRADVADNSMIVIAPTPSVTLTDKLIPFVALGYSSTCSSNVPDVFCRQWYDVILHGALQRLFMQPNKPYSSAQMAMYHGRAFRNGIAVARDRARKQFTTMETDFRFPSWA